MINHIGKVLERMIRSRQDTTAEISGWLPETQNGIIGSRETVDLLFCLRTLCSQCRKFHQPLHIAFIDLVKSYDKIDRDVLWLLLSRRGVPSNLINVIKGLHVGAQARVREAGQFSEAFP